MTRSFMVLFMWLLCALSAQAAAVAGATDDKARWRAVIANDFALPAGASIETLTEELSACLASTDPELRDDIAYRVLTQWLYVRRVVPPDLRRALIDDWTANLTLGIGERDTDTVFLRSFSALMLSVAVALDNEEAYLDEEGFDRLLEAALTYLRDERDTRGFDAQKGWLHSLAHTADLLKFLARSRHLEVADQSAILEGIAAKLGSVDHPLGYGEDERLARAVVSILARPDADTAAYAAFLEGLELASLEALPTPAELAINQNRKHLAVALHALLATDDRELPALAAAGERVRLLLTGML